LGCLGEGDLGHLLALHYEADSVRFCNVFHRASVIN
jgi:hypothetical protein